MAKWAFKVATFSPLAAADDADLTVSTYMGLVGNPATQRYDVTEVYMGGQATSSAPLYMILARSGKNGASTAVSTMAGGNQAPLDTAATVAASSVVFTSSVTKSQRASNAGLLNLTFNGFGGIVRWVAPPGSEIKQLGTAVSTGELTLSAYTGSIAAPIGAHVIYEAY